MHFSERLIEILGKDNITENVMMKDHSTFKTGGPADFYVTPSDIDQLKSIISACNEYKVKFHIHGNGSNVLFMDEGYRGVIISIGNNMSSVKVAGNKITAQAGIALSKLANEAANASLSGLEFAGGIPGTLGGAVTMNAGAYGGEIKDVIQSALISDCKGNIKQLDNKELQLGYRKSVIQDNNYIVLEASFILNVDDSNDIKARMKDFNKRRRDKQPLEYASAGSTFKRPEGYFAGKLIEDSGLKGYKVGGAMISEKHAGFVINTGNASSADIQAVISYVQEEVYRQQGVKLEREVRYIE